MDSYGLPSPELFPLKISYSCIDSPLEDLIMPTPITASMAEFVHDVPSIYAEDHDKSPVFAPAEYYHPTQMQDHSVDHHHPVNMFVSPPVDSNPFAYVEPRALQPNAHHWDRYPHSPSPSYRGAASPDTSDSLTPMVSPQPHFVSGFAYQQYEAPPSREDLSPQSIYPARIYNDSRHTEPYLRQTQSESPNLAHQHAQLPSALVSQHMSQGRLSASQLYHHHAPPSQAQSQAQHQRGRSDPRPTGIKKASRDTGVQKRRKQGQSQSAIVKGLTGASGELQHGSSSSRVDQVSMSMPTPRRDGNSRASSSDGAASPVSPATPAADYSAMGLTDEDKLLLYCKEEVPMPWKSVANRFAEEFNRDFNVATLQMRYHRLRKRIKNWSQAEVSKSSADSRLPRSYHANDTSRYILPPLSATATTRMLDAPSSSIAVGKSEARRY
jgi:hypothetical protein